MMKKLDLSECQACACFAVRRAARAITQAYDQALRPTGLRSTQFTLMVVLHNGGPQPLQLLAERLGMERTTLTRNLGPLVARGYVSERAGEPDPRVRVLLLTPAGERAAAAALPRWRRAQRGLAKQLTPRGLGALADLARTVA